MKFGQRFMDRKSRIFSFLAMGFPNFLQPFCGAGCIATHAIITFKCSRIIFGMGSLLFTCELSLETTLAPRGFCVIPRT
ncbi:MAG: hypothetical protein CMO21_13140 [Thioclava sp.]|nr:hypothetical protein [Thioclava sp.]